MIAENELSDTHQTDQQHHFKRNLNALDLILLGVGTVVGAGVFILSGIGAATKAGPAIIFSFILSGLTCAFSALSYAELASSVGGTGSAYSYTKASLGSTAAWFMGWTLLLGYGVASSAVAAGWGGYFSSLLQATGFHLSAKWINPPSAGGILDLPALMIVSFVALLLMIGTKLGMRFSRIIVLIKFIVLSIFVYITLHHLHAYNWHNFLPFGWSGVLSGAGFVFFAYIGFDAISTTTEETKNPQKTLPFAIIWTLIICTLIYIVISALLTLSVPYNTLNVSAPISQALLMLGYSNGAVLVCVGTIAGLTVGIIAMYYGLTRIIFAMANDHLLPKAITGLNPKTKTPIRTIIIAWFIIAAISSFGSLDTLVSVVNMTTLCAFIVVCSVVTIFHFTRKDMARPFNTPGKPWVPILGIILNTYLITTLPMKTLINFGLWLCVGAIVFVLYVSKNLKANSLKEKIS